MWKPTEARAMADGSDDAMAFAAPREGNRERASGVIERVGARVRAAREARGLTRGALAAASGVSIRYLAQIETGRGNTSIAVLAKVAGALETPIERFVATHAPLTHEQPEFSALFAAAPPEARAAALAALAGAETGRARRVALIGLRGAGKSTLGARLAAAAGARFVELNAEIEQDTGMPVSDLIALYGIDGYRRLEADAIRRVAASEDPVVLAVAGGVVGAEDAFETLLARFHAIWLKAAPEEHMDRVRAQGDQRPMAGNPAAMDQLRGLLAAREAAYARARFTLDTSGATPDESLEALRALIERESLLGA